MSACDESGDRRSPDVLSPASSPPESVGIGTAESERVVAALKAAVLQLGTPQELEPMLRTTVAGAVRVVPGVECAGISEIAADGTITSQAPTDERVGALDRIQAELAEGPCLEAIIADRMVRVDDLEEEADRWPTFAPRARKLGVASILSFRLATEGAPHTALNLYASKPAVFNDEARLLGELFASHATIAVAHARHSENLAAALESRDVIGQAKGMLVERFGVNSYEAFDMLVESSQQTHLKLIKVARWLTGHSDDEQQ